MGKRGHVCVVNAVRRLQTTARGQMHKPSLIFFNVAYTLRGLSLSEIVPVALALQAVSLGLVVGIDCRGTGALARVLQDCAARTGLFL